MKIILLVSVVLLSGCSDFWAENSRLIEERRVWREAHGISQQDVNRQLLGDFFSAVAVGAATSAVMQQQRQSQPTWYQQNGYVVCDTWMNSTTCHQ